VESDQDSAPESIPDTETRLGWNGTFKNPNDSEDYCMADDTSNIELASGIENREVREQQNVSAATTDLEFIWPPWRSTKTAHQMMMTVNTIIRKWTQGNAKM